MTDASRRMVGRRTVVRGAVATAWTVPLVQAVAATPALAGTVTSGPDITGSSASPVASGNTFTINASVFNRGSVATRTMTAVLSWTGSDGSTIVKTTPAPSGWSPVAMKDPVTSWTTDTPLAAGSSMPLKVSFTATNPAGKPKAAGRATLTVTEAGGSSASFSFDF